MIRNKYKAALLILGFLGAQYSAASSSLVKVEEGATGMEKLDFWTGFSLFRSPWVASPSSTTGRDGLGPLFNARACSSCHENGAHGRLPDDGPGLVARLGVYDDQQKKTVDTESYGGQLQTLSIKSMVNKTLPAEAQLKLEWQQQTLQLGNKVIHLKKPLPIFENLAYGPLSPDTRISLRLAPPLFGLGMLDRIPEPVLLKKADETDKDKDGISGKVAKVWDIEAQEWAVGRFGFKAEQPSLLQQTASAFHNDVGLSSWLYPMQNCAPRQKECLATVNGNSKMEGVEVSRKKLAMTTLFTKKLKRPVQPTFNKKQKQSAKRGEALFVGVGCAQCHTQSYEIFGDANEVTTIYPYSDLLLHDLGAGLSDNKPVHNASGGEWRTTPLWGIKNKLKSKSVRLLHDGRASSIEEAIAWHDGEAKKTAEQYFSLRQNQQDDLNLFVSNL